MKDLHLTLDVELNRKAGCLGTLLSVALASLMGYFTTILSGALAFPLIWMLIATTHVIARVVDLRTRKVIGVHDNVSDALKQIDQMRQHEFETGNKLPGLNSKDVMDMIVRNLTTNIGSKK